MPRPDLIALADEDLVAFTNRGTVQRAAKEAATLACDLGEGGDGAVRAAWADGVTVEIPAGRPLVQARCTCLAIGTCRHVVRTVLRYRRVHEGAVANGAPWDPGAITDAELERDLPKGALAAARRHLDVGVLAELVRSAKPLARIHGLGCNVRFRVPGDVRYASADCAPSAAPAMVALAVLAFRRLPPETDSGFVVTGAPALAPVEVLDAVDEAARAWLVHGLQGGPPQLAADLERLERRCVDEGLTWPAANVAAFGDELARYASHDALYSPEAAAAAVGELLARADAIRAATGAVPLPLVRGMREDKVAELGKLRLTGLGCSAVVRRHGVILRGFFQDLDSGSVSTVERDFADDADAREPPRPLSRLGSAIVALDCGLGQLARSEILLARAKRSAAGVLSLGRGKGTVSPQSFQWERLREPVLVEDLGELRARLLNMPPAALRPPRASDSLHVLAVRVADARFDPARQSIVARLLDAADRAALLVHPYVARAHDGCELLLARLQSIPARFVAGQVSLTSAGITIAPTAVVFEVGDRRDVLLPWVDSGAGGAAEDRELAALSGDPVAAYVGELQEILGQLLATGLRRADDVAARRLRAAAAAGESLGLGCLPGIAGALGAAIESKLRDPRSDLAPAAAVAARLSVLLRIAPDVL